MPVKPKRKANKRAKINSRAKGARGERELAEYLRERGYTARRGQQFSGVEGQDIVHDIPGVHIECKRVEAGNLYNWLSQAKRDAKTKVPIVMHKKNGKDWVAIMALDDMLNLLLLTGAPCTTN